jgi:hypothetical protein
VDYWELELITLPMSSQQQPQSCALRTIQAPTLGL